MKTQLLPGELDEQAVEQDEQAEQDEQDEQEHDPLRGLFERATEFEKTVRHFIQDNPTVALAGALTIGFLVGRVMR